MPRATRQGQDAGRKAPEDDDGGEDSNFRIRTILEPGTYFITVRGFDESTTGGYTISISTSTSIPVPINLNSSIAEALEIGGDVDIFQFTLSEPFLVILSTTGDTDTFGTLLDTTGAVLLADDDSGEDANFRIQSMLEPGTYFVAVNGFDESTTGNYTITVSNELPTTDDHGNTSATATAVNLNSATEGVLEVGGDVDVFQFILSEALLIRLSTTGDTDTFGTLLDNTGAILAEDDDSGEEVNFQIQRRLEPGMYFVTI